MNYHIDTFNYHEASPDFQWTKVFWIDINCDELPFLYFIPFSALLTIALFITYFRIHYYDTPPFFPKHILLTNSPLSSMPAKHHRPRPFVTSPSPHKNDVYFEIRWTYISISNRRNTFKNFPSVFHSCFSYIRKDSKSSNPDRKG